MYASASPTEHFGDEGYRCACRIHVYASDNEDAVEKAFFDLKNGQDARRLGTHSSATMKGKLFTLFISSILICEIRNRLSGLKENWTMDKVRQSLDKITFSTVRLSHSRKAKDLPGLVSAKQRLYLSKLLNCKPCEAEEKLFSMHIP